MTPWLEPARSPELLLATEPVLRWATLFFFSAFGAVWGSYLNVVVYRLPRGLSTALPGSHCPRCSSRIRPWQNVPVVSFLLLGARCGVCRGRISWRYPLVEAATAVIFVAAGLRFATWSEILFAWYVGFVLLALALIDLDWRGLPQILTLPTMVLALLTQPLLGWAEPGAALFAALVGWLALEGVARLWRRLGQGRGFGSGDAHMLAMVAAAFGPSDALRTLFFALLAALLLGLPARELGLLGDPAPDPAGGGSDRRPTLPFGLFLGFAALYVLLFDPAGVGVDRIKGW